MKKLIILLFAFITSSCYPDKKEATKFLQNQGYTNIKITGQTYGEWGGCAKNEYGTKFTAYNLNKAQVNGCVCEGIYKAKTIRFY